MKKFAFLILSLINAALTAVYVALLPLDIVPMHYNINGVADSYSSKWFVMLMPCILIVLGIIYLIYSIVAEKYEKLLKNQKYVECMKTIADKVQSKAIAWQGAQVFGAG